MNPSSKSKLLVAMVILLLVANAATITFFWISRGNKPPQPPAEPRDFLVKELQLDSSQQAQFELLRKEHRTAVDSLRDKVKEAKDKLFELVKDPAATDSSKIAAASAVSEITERIDLVTLDHFSRLRAICTPEQKEKFDRILHEVTTMIAAPRPPRPPREPAGPGREPRPDGPPPPPEK